MSADRLAALEPGADGETPRWQSLCERCGARFRARRATALFCGPACRKAANRARPERANDSERRAAIRRYLQRARMIGKIWPVYSWDHSPAVYALLVPRHLALAALSDLDDEMPVTGAELVAALKERDIADWNQPVERRLVDEFRAARKNRRVEA